MTVALPARLEPFPPERPGRMRIPEALADRGFSLRALHDGDLPWLRDLYASTRAGEMAPVPWPDATKRAFLDQQFALQHRHYLGHYGDADFMALERNGHGPVGRYYVLRAAPDHVLVDISLFPALRGNGLGHALIGHSQREAGALGRGMRLHVLQANPGARRLYERLGFTAEGDTGAYLAMRWSPAPA